MFEFALSGFIGAVASTIPIGPLNIALILLALKKDYVFWWCCLLGITAADVTIAWAAYLLMNSLWEQVFSPESTLCWTAGAHGLSAVLLIAGVIILWKQQNKRWALEQETDKAKTPTHGKAFAWFLWSFLMTAVEPGLLPFWSSWWMAMGHHAPLDFAGGIVMVTSIAGGDLLVFGFYRFLVYRFPETAQGNAFRRVIQWSLWLVIAAAVLIFLRFSYIIFTQYDGIKSCLF